MNKFFKFFVVSLIVALSVVGTVVVFYKNLSKQPKVNDVLKEYVNGMEMYEFSNSLLCAKSFSAGRMDLIYDTFVNLNEVCDEYIKYAYVYANKLDKNKELNTHLDNVLNSRANLNTLLKEYNLKSETIGYNKQLLNKLYVPVASYLIDYATMLKTLNDCLVHEVYDSESNVTYVVVELYADVVINAFSGITLSLNDEATLENITSIQLINNLDVINFSNGKISCKYPQKNLSIIQNRFINSYAKCNKAKLAQNLFSLVNATITPVGNTNLEQVAAYYFKELFV